MPFKKQAVVNSIIIAFVSFMPIHILACSRLSVVGDKRKQAREKKGRTKPTNSLALVLPHFFSLPLFSLVPYYREPVTGYTHPEESSKLRPLHHRRFHHSYEFVLIKWWSSDVVIVFILCWSSDVVSTVQNWLMLSVRISSYGCTREVWRTRKKPS